MPGIQRSLGLRKSQPRQNVEQVMPVALAAFQFAAFVNADLIGQLAARGHQLQRPARSHAHAGSVEQALQRAKVRPVVPVDPSCQFAQRQQQWMRLRKGGVPFVHDRSVRRGAARSV